MSFFNIPDSHLRPASVHPLVSDASQDFPLLGKLLAWLLWGVGERQCASLRSRGSGGGVALHLGKGGAEALSKLSFHLDVCSNARQSMGSWYH